MDKTGYIMAIDQGTTSTRAILFNHRGEVHSMGSREIKQIYPQPGWVEHDPIDVWQSVLDCAQEALKKGHASIDQVRGIGITNQRESTVLWERDTGLPVYNIIGWACRRSAQICDELKAAGRDPQIREKTGLLIDAYFSATKARWIIDNVPGVRQQIERNNIAMGCIDSWIIWNLSGGKSHVTDVSQASRTLLLNIHDIAWDHDILSWLDLPESILPTVMPSSGVMAMTDPAAFLGGKIPIAGDAGDQQAATYGQACFHPGMAKNSYGTALAVMLNIGEHPSQPSKNGLMVDMGWKIGNRVEYCLEGVIFNGGAAVGWMKNGLRVIKNAAECSALAERVPDNQGVYFVPALTGLGSPYWDMYARGIIIGITRGTTVEHIARSALESIAYQSRDVLESMHSDSGTRARSLRVDGGGTQSDLLMQFQADILGIPVERPVVTEMASLGAAYLAGLGVGFWESQEELEKQWKVDKTYTPRMGEDQRESLYFNWKRAVERSFKWVTP
jgi:glycerol kinase